MKISYTTVTWYSQIAAIVLFIAIYFLGFYVGRQYEMVKSAPVSGMTMVSPAVPEAPVPSAMSAMSAEKLLNNVTFICPNSSVPAAAIAAGTAYIAAQFLEDASGKGLADIELSDGRMFILPQAISADGARYANADGSFVFWNKGNGAFIEENGTTTYGGCVTK